MRVLTFGWEFPPFRNGGLGVACYGLTRELINDGIEVLFVLPRQQETSGNATFLFAGNETLFEIHEVESWIRPYLPVDTMVDVVVGYDSDGNPIFESRSLIEEIHRFAHQASIIARREKFDLIHAHDWSSYLAGIAAKRVSGRPLVVHVHATSYDQAGGDNVDPRMLQIEHEGFAEADKVVTVSQYTKDILIQKHQVPEQKIEVIHNGVDLELGGDLEPALASLKASGKKVVLYHGRISIQKGVDYFVQAARKVIDHDPNVVFIISGWGDMTTQIIEEVGRLGLSEYVRFAGPLWDTERDRMYKAADIVVMPSVSEPFGLVPLEAIQHGACPIISKQSGVGEVLSHTLRMDFWDVDEMANKILAAVRYPVLRQQIVAGGRQELTHLSWKKAATKVRSVYHNLLELVP